MKPAVIALPERLDEPSLQVMAAALGKAAPASAVVLVGAPGRFCLGMDFEAASAAGTGRAGQMVARRQLEAFAHCLARVLASPRPTVAMVDGPAFGGGVGLAAACDVVLATERACFGLPEALYGLSPAIIRPALLTRLSPQQINLLLFTCHSRSAEEAAVLGLVDRVVPLQQLEAAQREILRQFSRVRSETVAVSRSWNAGEVERGLRAGIEETLAALCNEGVAAPLRKILSQDGFSWSG